MNIFLRELKANRKALILWCACMVVGVLSGMAKYTAYSSGGANNRVFDELPSSIKALLGMGDLDVTTIGGFFALLFLYLSILIAFHAALLGSGILAKEERDKTAEFLIVKPVSRSAVLTAKLLAALVNVVVLNAVTLISSVFMVRAYSGGKDITGEIVLFFVSLLFVQLIFLALGVWIAASMKSPKGSGSVAAGIVLGAYIVAEITSVDDRLDALNVLSPFKYFSYDRIVAGNGLDPGVAALSFLLAAAFTALAYLCYRKRDLSV